MPNSISSPSEPQEKKIAKAWGFPLDMDQGFGFMAPYKVSPDRKLLDVPGASPYRLTVTDDPYDDAAAVTSVFTAVDPVVYKGRWAWRGST